jgi:hypothetical protein
VPPGPDAAGQVRHHLRRGPALWHTRQTAFDAITLRYQAALSFGSRSWVS